MKKQKIFLVLLLCGLVSNAYSGLIYDSSIPVNSNSSKSKNPEDNHTPREGSLNIITGKVLTAVEKTKGSKYALFDYLDLSTYDMPAGGGGCPAANPEKIPEANYANLYEVEAKCTAHPSVARVYVKARDKYVNSRLDVRKALKAEKKKIAAAKAKKEKERKAQEAKEQAELAKKQTVPVSNGKCPAGFAQVESKKDGNCYNKNPIGESAVSAFQQASTLDPTSSNGGGLVVSANSPGERNEHGLLPGDKGKLKKEGEPCNQSRTVGDKTFCYETVQDRINASSSQGLEGQDTVRKQKERKLAEEKKKKFKATLGKGKTSFSNTDCTTAGFSEVECSGMKEKEDARIAEEAGGDQNNSDNPQLDVSDEEATEISSAVNDCVKERGKQALDKCEEEVGQNSETVQSVINSASPRDDGELVEAAQRDIATIASEIKNLDDLDCLKDFTSYEGGVQQEEKAYFNGNMLKIIGQKTGGRPVADVDGSKVSMYNSISKCSKVLEPKFIDADDDGVYIGEEGFAFLCNDILKSKRNELRAANLHENNVGESCKNTEGQGANQGAYDQNVYDSCMVENKLKLTDDAARIADCQTRSKRANNSSVEEIKPECKQAYQASMGIIDKEINQEVAAGLLEGCVSIKKVSKIVKDNDLDEPDELSYQSIDSLIKCTARRREEGAYAIDYGACKKAAYWYNGAYLTADLAAPVIGNAMGVYKDADIQGDMQRELASGGVDAQTASLRAQKRRYKSKANSEAAEGALQTTKAIAMFGNVMAYPTPKVVSEEWCGNDGATYENLSAPFSCGAVEMAKNGEIKNDLFANQEVKDVLIQVGAKSLSKAIVHAIVSGSYKKRAKLVGKVEDALTNADFNNPDNQIDIGPSFCAQNPTIPSCINGGGGGRIANSGVDFSFDGIGAQGGGDLNDLDSADLDGSGSPNNAVRPSGKTKDELGNILSESSGGKFDGGFKKVGAAKVGAGGAGGGGSGGGGGGGASGGGGGGGGGGPEAKNGPGGQKNFGKKTFGKYTAGSNGKFTSGSSARTKKKSRNPFAALSGKGRNRKIASQVEKQLLPKKVQLFEVISKRYAAVSKDRLTIAKENLLTTQKDGAK